MPDPEDSRSYAAARVTRTGIALVHEGELIFPADGSEVEAVYVSDDQHAVHYHFPVEIEVRSAAPAAHPDEAMQRSHRLFALSLDGQ